MLEVAFAIPGDLTQPTGGYGYARSVIAAAATLGPIAGMTLRPIRLPDGFPFPSADDLAETERLLAETPPGQPILVDGLAFGALPQELLRRLNRPWVALCHHPLALETGLSRPQSDLLRASEIAAFGAARQVVVTSAATAGVVAREFHVASSKLTIAAPGVDRRPQSLGMAEPPQMLAVGSLVPRKGYDVLIAALRQLSDRPWRCQIVGSVDRDEATATAIRAAIDQAGLADRIVLRGTITAAELDRAYAEASIFVHAAHYEGYGMAVADALAAGLPVIGADAAATADLVDAGSGLLFAVGDADGLAAAIAALLDDPRRRRDLAKGAWAAGRRLPDWPQAAAQILRACQAAIQDDAR